LARRVFLHPGIPTGGPRRLPTITLSSRPKRPDFSFRAAFWRVGPRSGGIAAPSPRLGSNFAFAISLLNPRFLIADNPLSSLTLTTYN